EPERLRRSVELLVAQPFADAGHADVARLHEDAANVEKSVRVRIVQQTGPHAVGPPPAVKGLIPFDGSALQAPCRDDRLEGRARLEGFGSCAILPGFLRRISRAVGIEGGAA